jgi:hypothetical protein
MLITNIGKILSQASTLLQSVDPRVTVHRRCCSFATFLLLQLAAAHSFRGFFPFDVFLVARSDIPQQDPPLLITLRPQGFSPSRRFAPPATCQAYFILDPSLGFLLRGVSPHHQSTRFLKRRLPLEVGNWLHSQKLRVIFNRLPCSSSGLSSGGRYRPKVRGLAEVSSTSLHGFCSFRGVLRCRSAYSPSFSVWTLPRRSFFHLVTCTVSKLPWA